MKITVLSPHRDDAAFSVGLAIGTWIEAGHTVEVLNCFTESRYSPFGDVKSFQGSDLCSSITALRHREDVLWSGQYRRPVTLVDLKLCDAPQRLHCGVEEVCTITPQPDDPSLGKIRISLKHSAADALVLPLAVGGHVDHLTACLGAVCDWPKRLPIAFYEDLPYAARPGMAEGIAARVNTVAPGFEASFAGVPVELSMAGERKRRLALCYDSQIDSDTAEQIAGFCARYGGRERLWINGRWSASVLAELR